MGLSFFGLQEFRILLPRVRAIRGAGFIWGLDVGEPAGEVVARARDAGLLLLTAGDYTLRILPPLVMSREDIERGLAILEQVISPRRTQLR